VVQNKSWVVPLYNLPIHLSTQLHLCFSDIKCLEVSALETYGHQTFVRDHVTAGEAEGLNEGTALSEANDSSIVKECAAFEIDDLQS
jgi:hypothetical protein